MPFCSESITGGKIHLFLVQTIFFNFKKKFRIVNMAKYNRICVTISDSNNTKLNSIVDNTNKKINVTKSAIVDLALNKFFETISNDSIASELSEQLVVD